MRQTLREYERWRPEPIRSDDYDDSWFRERAELVSRRLFWLSQYVMNNPRSLRRYAVLGAARYVREDGTEEITDDAETGLIVGFAGDAFPREEWGEFNRMMDGIRDRVRSKIGPKLFVKGTDGVVREAGRQEGDSGARDTEESEG